MNTIINALRLFVSSRLVISAVIICAPVLLCRTSRGDGAELSSMLVLKHRIAVSSLSEFAKNKQQSALILKTADPLVYFRAEGVVMDLEDWASAVDLAKSEIAKSEYMRVVELPGKFAAAQLESPSAETPNLVLILSFGSTGQGRRLYCRLFEVSSGQVVFSTDSAGPDFKKAVGESIVKCENWLLTQAWRCRVIGVRKDRMVINRGQLDGLREGVRLLGYSLKIAADKFKEPDELILLKHGEKIGTFTVTEVKNNYAVVRMSEGSRMLAAGDILEMPEIRLMNRDLKSRGSRVWDKIYEK